MADEDKLMGWRDDVPVFAAYRIDYDSNVDIRYRPDGNGSKVMRDLPGAAKSPPPEAESHPTKQGYHRKVIVEDEGTLDSITEVLNRKRIAYVIEDVSPTRQERDAIVEYGADHGIDAVEALLWNDAIESVKNIGDMKQVERGRHPVTGEEFDRPKSKKRKS